MNIRVVLADDHAMVRESLTSYLACTPDIRVVVAVACAEDALAATVRCQPDLVLLDIDMPGMVVFDAARRIRTMCPSARLVILSAFFHDRYIEQALAAGACGYLTKTEPLTRIVQAIRDVANGAAYFSPQVRARLVIDEAGVRLSTPPHTRVSSLSPRELEVLRQVARGLSNKEIAAALRVAARTVDHHVAGIMNKLDLHGRVGLAQFAVREGLAEP